MKFIKNTLFFFLGMQIFISCEKHLDRFPLDKITEVDFWSSPNDLKLYVNQFYTSFPTHNGYTGGLFWADNNSDNMIWGTYNTRLAGFNTEANSNGNYNAMTTLNWDYSRIRACNIALENLHRVKGAAAALNTYTGELYFFRAYYYYHLVKTYGDVPWVNKSMNIDDEDLYKARTSRTIVIDSVLADLQKAIGLLGSKSNSESHRLNREAALLFRSRVALNEGTWQKYHAGTEFGTAGANWNAYLDTAAVSAKRLIDMNTAALYTSATPATYFADLFGNNDPTAIKEILLWKKYDLNLAQSHRTQQYLYSGGNVGLSKSLVESFLCTDGLPISVSSLYQGDDSTARLVQNRDPRLAQSMWVPGDYVSSSGTGPVYFTVAWLTNSGEQKCVSGYQLKKGKTKRPELGTADLETAGIVFRYAEALLNYAEAKAELGTITQSDLDISINKLRSRAGMPNLNMSSITTDPNWEFSTVSPLINEIRRERRVELMCEGFRFDDLCRWRAMSTIIGKRPLGARFVAGHYPTLTPGVNVLVDANGYIDPYKTALPNGNQFKENRDYLLPVPRLEITINKSIVQNPNWQ